MFKRLMFVGTEEYKIMHQITRMVMSNTLHITGMGTR
jgi:hypothetical protein